MSMEWSKELATNDSKIDAQHQELFHRVENLISAIKIGKGKEETRKILGFLSNYVVFHFETEEKYMNLNKYPGFAAHVSEHKKFMVELNNIKSDFETTDDTSSMVTLIQNKLIDWLLNHIGKLDKEFAKFLNEKEQ